MMKNDGKGPVARGVFELTKEDLKELVTAVNEGEKAEFKISMWPSKVSAKGNKYNPLSIDKWKPDNKPAANNTASFMSDAPDDEIPF